MEKQEQWTAGGYSADFQFMNFSDALEAMKLGFKVRDVDWDDWEHFIMFVRPKLGLGEGVVDQRYIAKFLHNAGYLPHPYTPTNLDIISEGWVIVDEELPSEMPLYQLQYVNEAGNLSVKCEGSLEECEQTLKEDSNDGVPEHQIVRIEESAILFKEEKEKEAA